MYRISSGGVADLENRYARGEAIPAIGFGTFTLTGKLCESMVEDALMVGYRHIDTARAYENESDIGAAMTKSPVNREDVFLTTKVWLDELAADRLKQSIENSLNDLDTDYIDLGLIHWPSSDVSIEESIGALKELKDAGRIKHIGVSNFNAPQLQRAMACGPIFCNQIEYHTFLDQSEILQIASANNILVTAYCPLAQGKVLKSETIAGVAAKHGRTPAQVALRWLVEQPDVLAIPRSTNSSHLRQNLEVFDFELDEEDRDRINRLPKDHRLIDPDFAPDWNES